MTTAKVGQDKLKGTCLFFADRPGSLDRMTELFKHHEGRIVAARIHAYAPNRLAPFGKPELRAFWRHVGDLGLAVQLHFEPRYAPGFEPLIKEFPHTTVIIDHLGRPFQGSAEEYAVVLGWARLPNTIMKLSAAVPAPAPDVAGQWLKGTVSIFLSPVGFARALRSSSQLPGTTARQTPCRSPRATKVLKTCLKIKVKTLPAEIRPNRCGLPEHSSYGMRSARPTS
jgi:hypothetical protein